MKRAIMISSALLCVGFAFAPPARAQDETAVSEPAAQPFAHGASKSGGTGSLRSKSIDFEGEVVEGLNKNPMDALEHTATKDKGDKGHLYRKKEHFRPEMKQLVRDMGFKR